MDTNYKMNRLFAALKVVREMTEEMESLHAAGLTYREVDEAMFGTNPGHHEDVSGKITHCVGPFSWLKRFARYLTKR